MSHKTDYLDGFVFAHGNISERAEAIFGKTGSRFGIQYPDITQQELSWWARERDLYNDELDRYMEIKKKHARLLKKVGSSKSLGPREFTLTYSPQWGWDDTEAQNNMKRAIERLVRYHSGTLIEMRAVGEVCKDGKSHIHCYYKLQDGLKITDKNFKRAYDKWDTKIKLGKTGHQGGHHALVHDDAAFRGYIEKEIDGAWFEYNFSV